MVKAHRKLFKKLVKSRRAVSPVLAAIMMIILLVSAMGVVWGWLFPAYRRFQTINAINNVTSYMLRVDETIYHLLGEGEGALSTINLDAFAGQYRYDLGNNVSFSFTRGTNVEIVHVFDKIGQSLGAFSYLLFARGAVISIGAYKYLKGPTEQPIFFVNDTETNTYNGQTILNLTRPEDRTMRIDLSYRVKLYSWFDSTNNVLTIAINVLFLEASGGELYLGGYNQLKLYYNRTEVIYSNSYTNVDTDLLVSGSLSRNFSPVERVLTFPYPGSDYDVNYEIVGTFITLFM